MPRSLRAWARATVARILRREGLNRLHALDPREPARRYENTPAGCCTWTSRSSAASKAWDIGSPASASTAPVGSAGTSSTWRSTMLLDWPAWRSFRTSARSPQLPFSSGRGQLRPLQHPSPAPAHRQRFVLSLTPLRRSPPRPWPQAQLHQTLPAQDQRQGRTLHSTTRTSSCSA